MQYGGYALYNVLEHISCIKLLLFEEVNYSTSIFYAHNLCLFAVIKTLSVSKIFTVFVIWTLRIIFFIKLLSIQYYKYNLSVLTV